MFMCTEEPTNQNAIRAGVQQPVLGSVQHLGFRAKVKSLQEEFQQLLCWCRYCTGVIFYLCFFFPSSFYILVQRLQSHLQRCR